MKMLEKTKAERLREAAAIVRKAWTQGAYAKTATGETTAPWATDAVCWCARGAIQATMERHEEWGAFGAVEIALAKSLIGEGLADEGLACQSDVARFNDAEGRTAEEVATAMERAAVRLEATS